MKVVELDKMRVEYEGPRRLDEKRLTVWEDGIRVGEDVYLFIRPLEYGGIDLSWGLSPYSAQPLGKVWLDGYKADGLMAMSEGALVFDGTPPNADWATLNVVARITEDGKIGVTYSGRFRQYPPITLNMKITPAEQPCEKDYVPWGAPSGAGGEFGVVTAS